VIDAGTAGGDELVIDGEGGNSQNWNADNDTVASSNYFELFFIMSLIFNFIPLIESL